MRMWAQVWLEMAAVLVRIVLGLAASYAIIGLIWAILLWGPKWMVTTLANLALLVVPLPVLASFAVMGWLHVRHWPSWGRPQEDS